MNVRLHATDRKPQKQQCGTVYREKKKKKRGGEREKEREEEKRSSRDAASILVENLLREHAR